MRIISKALINVVYFAFVKLIGDHFGGDVKRNGHHFGVDFGIISGLGIISGALQASGI